MCTGKPFIKFSLFECFGRLSHMYSCRSEICKIGVVYLSQFEQESSISISIIIFPFKRKEKRGDHASVAGLQTRLMKYTCLKIKITKYFHFNSDLFLSRDIRNVFLSKYYLFGLNVQECPIQGIYCSFKYIFLWFQIIIR